MKINKKLFKIIQSIIIVTIFFLAFKELYKIFVDIDINLFKKYADRLTLPNLLIIALLGIVSYMPLSFYDLITRKSIPIDLPTKKVYKYSWIATSISNIVGFGGSSAILIKNYFYKNHVDDQSKLTKENLKVVGLNLSGFSLICLIYSIWCAFTIKKFELLIEANGGIPEITLDDSDVIRRCALTLKRYLEKYGPFIDENGDEVTVPVIG